MKRIVSLVLAILMAVALLSACASSGASGTGTTGGQASTGSGGTAEAGNDPVELTLWHFPVTEDAEDLFSQLAAAVKEQYPYITLKPEMLSWDAGPERLTVAMATGTTPDLLFDAQSRVNPAIFAGLCADITDVREQTEPDMMAGYEEYGLVDGKYYFLPTHNGNGYYLAVNMGLLRELGLEEMLPEDKVHWSYDDFLALCRAVREKGAAQDIYPIQLYAGSRSSDAAMYSYIMSSGASIMNEDLTGMAVNSPEALECLNMLKALIDEGLVPDGPATTKDETVGAVFQSGKIVFKSAAAGAQDIILYRDRAQAGEAEEMDLDIVCLPTPDGVMDPHVANWGAGGMVVFKNGGDAAKIDAAKKVILTLWNDIELMNHMFLLMGQSPINKNVVLDYGDDHINEAVARAGAWNGLYSDSSIGILEPWWTDWREIFYVELQEFYVGNQTAEQMLENWTAKGNAVIENYNANAR